MHVVNDLLNNIQFGEPTSHLNAVVLPLHSAEDPLPYLTMDEAMEQGALTITEVFEKGIVSRLAAVNSGTMPVLLLDGEELLGGKQNRALNTSILVKEHSRLTLPVTCTEHARWSSSAASMAAADIIMPRNVRARKLQSVSASLEKRATFSSDQHGVWHDIAALRQQSRSPSAATALSGLFADKAFCLQSALKAIPPQPGQTGLLVLIDDAVVGFDLLSSARAYARLHSKLLKCYLLETILSGNLFAADHASATQSARAFLDQVAQCEPRQFPSLGCGHDWRFAGNTVAGMVLVHDNCPVHTAFFPAGDLSPSRRAFCLPPTWRRPDIGEPTL